MDLVRTRGHHRKKHCSTATERCCRATQASSQHQCTMCAPLTFRWSRHTARRTTPWSSSVATSSAQRLEESRSSSRRCSRPPWKGDRQTMASQTPSATTRTPGPTRVSLASTIHRRHTWSDASSHRRMWHAWQTVESIHHSNSRKALVLLRVLLLPFTDMSNSKASIALLVLLWLVLRRYRPIIWVLESMWIGELYLRVVLRS